MLFQDAVNATEAVEALIDYVESLEGLYDAADLWAKLQTIQSTRVEHDGVLFLNSNDENPQYFLLNAAAITYLQQAIANAQLIESDMPSERIGAVVENLKSVALSAEDDCQVVSHDEIEQRLSCTEDEQQKIQIKQAFLSLRSSTITEGLGMFAASENALKQQASGPTVSLDDENLGGTWDSSTDEMDPMDPNDDIAVVGPAHLNELRRTMYVDERRASPTESFVMINLDDPTVSAPDQEDKEAAKAVSAAKEAAAQKLKEEAEARKAFLKQVRPKTDTNKYIYVPEGTKPYDAQAIFPDQNVQTLSDGILYEVNPTAGKLVAAEGFSGPDIALTEEQKKALEIEKSGTFGLGEKSGSTTHVFVVGTSAQPLAGMETTTIDGQTITFYAETTTKTVDLKDKAGLASEPEMDDFVRVDESADSLDRLRVPGLPDEQQPRLDQKRKRWFLSSQHRTGGKQMEPEDVAKGTLRATVRGAAVTGAEKTPNTDSHIMDMRAGVENAYKIVDSAKQYRAQLLRSAGLNPDTDQDKVLMLRVTDAAAGPKGKKREFEVQAKGTDGMWIAIEGGVRAQNKPLGNEAKLPSNEYHWHPQHSEFLFIACEDTDGNIRYLPIHDSNDELDEELLNAVLGGDWEQLVECREKGTFSWKRDEGNRVQHCVRQAGNPQNPRVVDDMAQDYARGIHDAKVNEDAAELEREQARQAKIDAKRRKEAEKAERKAAKKAAKEMTASDIIKDRGEVNDDYFLFILKYQEAIDDTTPKWVLLPAEVKVDDNQSSFEASSARDPITLSDEDLKALKIQKPTDGMVVVQDVEAVLISVGTEEDEDAEVTYTVTAYSPQGNDRYKRSGKPFTQTGQDPLRTGVIEKPRRPGLGARFATAVSGMHMPRMNMPQFGKTRGLKNARDSLVDMEELDTWTVVPRPGSDGDNRSVHTEYDPETMNGMGDDFELAAVLHSQVVDSGSKEELPRDVTREPSGSKVGYVDSIDSDPAPVDKVTMDELLSQGGNIMRVERNANSVTIGWSSSNGDKPGAHVYPLGKAKAILKGFPGIEAVTRKGAEENVPLTFHVSNQGLETHAQCYMEDGGTYAEPLYRKEGESGRVRNVGKLPWNNPPVEQDEDYELGSYARTKPKAEKKERKSRWPSLWPSSGHRKDEHESVEAGVKAPTEFGVEEARDQHKDAFAEIIVTYNKNAAKPDEAVTVDVRYKTESGWEAGTDPVHVSEKSAKKMLPGFPNLKSFSIWSGRHVADHQFVCYAKKVPGGLSDVEGSGKHSFQVQAYKSIGDGTMVKADGKPVEIDGELEKLLENRAAQKEMDADAFTDDGVGNPAASHRLSGTSDDERPSELLIDAFPFTQDKLIAEGGMYIHLESNGESVNITWKNADGGDLVQLTADDAAEMLKGFPNLDALLAEGTAENTSERHYRVYKTTGRRGRTVAQEYSCDYVDMDITDPLYLPGVESAKVPTFTGMGNPNKVANPSRLPWAKPKKPKERGDRTWFTGMSMPSIPRRKGKKSQITEDASGLSDVPEAVSVPEAVVSKVDFDSTAITFAQRQLGTPGVKNVLAVNPQGEQVAMIEFQSDFAHGEHSVMSKENYTVAHAGYPELQSGGRLRKKLAQRVFVTTAQGDEPSSIQAYKLDKQGEFIKVGKPVICDADGKPLAPEKPPRKWGRGKGKGDVGDTETILRTGQDGNFGRGGSMHSVSSADVEWMANPTAHAARTPQGDSPATMPVDTQNVNVDALHPEVQKPRDGGDNDSHGAAPRRGSVPSWMQTTNLGNPGIHGDQTAEKRALDQDENPNGVGMSGDNPPIRWSNVPLTPRSSAESVHDVTEFDTGSPANGDSFFEALVEVSANGAAQLSNDDLRVVKVQVGDKIVESGTKHKDATAAIDSAMKTGQFEVQVSCPNEENPALPERRAYNVTNKANGSIKFTRADDGKAAQKDDVDNAIRLALIAYLKKPNTRGYNTEVTNKHAFFDLTVNKNFNLDATAIQDKVNAVLTTLYVELNKRDSARNSDLNGLDEVALDALANRPLMFHFDGVQGAKKGLDFATEVKAGAFASTPVKGKFDLGKNRRTGKPVKLSTAQLRKEVKKLNPKAKAEAKKKDEPKKRGGRRWF